MRVNTGKGTISLLTLMAIWAISLTVNLPGLAVTPMLGNLDRIFPHVSELEIQLLTVLPNLCIIPFVLLSGKLSLSKDKITIVVVALVIYLASGILYFFASSMPELIIISCLLGVGCGLLIPLAAGLLADTFVGKYRMKQLGIKSGISNLALVVATFLTGWLSHGNWHLPFLVYLIPAIPLALSPFLRGIPKVAAAVPAATPPHAVKVASKEAAHASLAGVPAKAVHPLPHPAQAVAPLGHIKDGFILGRTWTLIGVYFLTCYASVIISYYAPFLLQKYGMPSSATGTLTALFFLAVFLPGFCLPAIVRALRQTTLIVCSAAMAVGVFLMTIGHDMWVMGAAVILVGAGYGVFQPLIYDKATRIVTDPAKYTLALAFVLTANYLSVSVTPFIVDGFAKLFHAAGSQTFPFTFNAVVLAVFTLVVILCRKSFVFSIEKSYYS